MDREHYPLTRQDGVSRTIGSTMIAGTGSESKVDLESAWVERYGQKHQMRRVSQWPLGITPPKKVRVYWRHDHWVLQWWEPSAGKNVAQRVDGDIISAVATARELDEKLQQFKRSGQLHQRIGHSELVQRYVADLTARADAGEIEAKSLSRYRSALAHYLAFSESPQINRKWPLANDINRNFALELATFLRNRKVFANGRAAGRAQRPMKCPQFVLDVARSLFAWAADVDRGNVLGEGFRNPFLRKLTVRQVSRDPFGEPDVSVAMAVRLLEAADEYQLRLFAPMVFFGLRAAEPVYLFGEYIDDQWLRVPCNSDIGYTTKGKREKRLPLFDPLTKLLGLNKAGLLYLRRGVVEGMCKPPLLGCNLSQLAVEYQHRIQQSVSISAAQRLKIREKLLQHAGGISYDAIEAEFRCLATRLDWPAAATLKDLRHLFATAMAAGGMPEPYRQYLMGHATSSAAIGVYTHLNRIREHYLAAVERELKPLVELIQRRTIASTS